MKILVTGGRDLSGAIRQSMEGVERVYHMSAMVSVPRSSEEPRAAIETNVIGTLNVLEAAKAAGVGKLTFNSSSAIYGDGKGPLSLYAQTKLDGEFLCRMGFVPAVIARLFNVYGPRQNPAGGLCGRYSGIFSEPKTGEVAPGNG